MTPFKKVTKYQREIFQSRLDQFKTALPDYLTPEEKKEINEMGLERVYRTI